MNRKGLSDDDLANCENVHTGINKKIGTHLLKKLDGVELAPFSSCSVYKTLLYVPIHHIGRERKLEELRKVLMGVDCYRDIIIQEDPIEHIFTLIAVFQWADEQEVVEDHHHHHRKSVRVPEIYPPTWTIATSIIGIILSVSFGALKPILFNL